MTWIPCYTLMQSSRNCHTLVSARCKSGTNNQGYRAHAVRISKRRKYFDGFAAFGILPALDNDGSEAREVYSGMLGGKTIPLLYTAVGGLTHHRMTRER